MAFVDGQQLAPLQNLESTIQIVIIAGGNVWIPKEYLILLLVVLDFIMSLKIQDL